MKTTTTLFAKEISTGNNKTKALIEVSYGDNKKGSYFQSVNQINTANAYIDDVRLLFEALDKDIPPHVMEEVVKAEGYSFIVRCQSKETYQDWKEKNLEKFMNVEVAL